MQHQNGPNYIIEEEYDEDLFQPRDKACPALAVTHTVHGYYDLSDCHMTSQLSPRFLPPTLTLYKRCSSSSKQM
ncbi:RNA polymerase II Elongator subunit [Aspergillus luchuensis]|uniref:RNA polymerase II Elongator subunit n=1 Tax=Aspergillus kawachii TaxID=1069201 RepID=A0A146EYZ7_ASPKA|nr:RNA polymerase II Elongator subunit [Aspergillus luchuensis]